MIDLKNKASIVTLAFIMGALTLWLIQNFDSTGKPYSKSNGVMQARAVFTSPFFASDTVPTHTSRTHMVPQILPIPDVLEFCGETVDINQSDIRERYEKELYITANINYQVMFYLKRAPRIFPFIEKELRNAGLPDDLKYLAVVESDLIPVLISARGARGLWQFMPETAREYSMIVNNNIDERLHLEKSTTAAFKYLKHARERTGSWAMAAAAYNMGLTRALTTMRDQYTRDYFRLHMNQETSRYVFKILAVKAIIENPEAFGYFIDENEVYSLPETKEIKINSAIEDLPKWAVDQGSTYYDLRRVNPWIVGTSLPKGEYVILVPK